MGCQKSKIIQPNNSFEMNQFKSVIIEEKQWEIEKEIERDKKRNNTFDIKNRTQYSVDNNEMSYNIQSKYRMQHQLAFDSESFFLNQLMLSIQFFENFEMEMREGVERNRKHENELTNVFQQYSKTILLPNRLSEIIDTNVKFCARHGRTKNIISSLQNRIIYIVHENIEVSHPGEPAVYSIVTDAPIYKIEIDFSAHSNYCPIGYCRLRNCEIITKTINHIEEKNPIEDEDEHLETKFKSFTRVKLRDSILLHLRSRNSITKIPIPSESNSTTSTESDYEYAIAMNYHQPLMKISKNANLISLNSLPDTCISKNSVSPDQFLNSKVFLINFLRNFYKKLGYLLHLSNEEVERATWMGASIYGNNWQVTPSIACPWPKEAFEWIHRYREIIENPSTKQKFQWPNRKIVNKVISFGCHVIPVYSFQTKTDQNREIEWKIIFPDAERYLESCLTSTQIKVFVIMIALIKTHVEPHIDSKKNQLTAEHLRCLLFWQCENNCAAWPEDYLGEALMRYLQSLLKHLKKQKLPDYFLPERNLFENISTEILAELHQKIYRIIENPAVHLIVALRNLKYKQKMLPLLNFRKFFAAITIENPLKIINPTFRTENDRLNGIDNEIDQIYFDVNINSDIPSRKTRRVAFADENTFLKSEKRQDSIETIDIKLVPVQHTNQLRRIILFEIFVKHFINMSEVFSEHCSWNLSLIYLKHAARICSLLTEDGCKASAEDFLNQIKDIYRRVMENRNQYVTKNLPKLPQRQNSLRLNEIVDFQLNCIDFFEEEKVGITKL